MQLMILNVYIKSIYAYYIIRWINNHDIEINNFEKFSSSFLTH